MNKYNDGIVTHMSLSPIKTNNLYQHEKSFYNKCHIEINSVGDMSLWSYETCVACINAKGIITINGLYSRTTERHIEAFLETYRNKWINKYPDLQYGKNNLRKYFKLDNYCYSGADYLWKN